MERLANQIKIIIKTSRPGIVIGRKGSEVEELRRDIQQLTGNQNIQISVEEVSIPEIDAQLVAENVASQIERRVSYRRAMKQAINRALRMGAQGIKISLFWPSGGSRNCSGRVVSRGLSSPSHFAGRYRLWLCRGSHHLWENRSKSLDI